MKNDVSYVRLDVLENWRFWHGFKDYESAGKEVLAQADALLAMDFTNERAAQLLRESLKFRRAKQSAGQQGGIAKKQKKDSSIPTKEDFYAYVAANDLDEAYSREWYDMCVARGWKDRDGNPIVKWKGALANYVKARVANAIAAAVKEAK